MKISKNELTDVKKAEILKNIKYNDDGDFRSTLIAGQYHYRVSSSSLKHLEAANFCKNRNSKLAEIKNEDEKNVVNFLLNETLKNG